MDNLKKMGCGNCGHDKHIIYTNQKPGGAPFQTLLVVECVSCGNMSNVSITQPKIEIGCHEDSSGCIAVSR